MIYIHFLVLLILIPNIFTARMKEGIRLSFPSTLTEIDDDIININDDYKNPKLTYRRQARQGTKNSVVVQNSAKFKILNHRTSTKIVKFPNDNDYKPVLFAPRWDKSPKQETCNKQGQTYCVNAPDYPEEEIRHLLAIAKINISAYHVDISDDDISNIDLANRIDSRNKEPLCLSNSKTIKPNKAETEEGEWLFVAPDQVVQVEECAETVLNKRCSLLQLPTTKCEQKYLLRKLYALDPVTGSKSEIREVKFKFPSCCMCMVYNAGRRRRHPKHDDNERQKTKRGINPDFAYPDQIPDLPKIATRFGSIGNITCTEQIGSVCTNVSNYPKDIIANLRKKGAFKKSPLFGKEEPSLELSTRSDSGGVPMCGVMTKVIFPKAAENLKNELKIVVQDEEGGFVQGIVAEYCVNSQPCNFAQHFPSNYVTTCREQHIARLLETIDKSGNSGPDYMKIPSCCACHGDHDTSLLTKP